MFGHRRSTQQRFRKRQVERLRVEQFSRSNQKLLCSVVFEMMKVLYYSCFLMVMRIRKFERGCQRRFLRIFLFLHLTWPDVTSKMIRGIIQKEVGKEFRNCRTKVVWSENSSAVCRGCITVDYICIFITFYHGLLILLLLLFNCGESLEESKRNTGEA